MGVTARRGGAAAVHSLIADRRARLACGQFGVAAEPVRPDEFERGGERPVGRAFGEEGEGSAEVELFHGGAFRRTAVIRPGEAEGSYVRACGTRPERVGHDLV